MTTYIVLLRFTDQGARNLKESPTRATAFRKTTEAAGVNVLGLYWTVGKYDGVLILQAETEATVLRAIANLAATGNVRPHSLRAFDATEFAAIVGA